MTPGTGIKYSNHSAVRLGKSLGQYPTWYLSLKSTSLWSSTLSAWTYDMFWRSRSNDPTCRVLVEEEDLFDLGREQGDDLAEHRLSIKWDDDKSTSFLISIIKDILVQQLHNDDYSFFSSFYPVFFVISAIYVLFVSYDPSPPSCKVKNTIFMKVHHHLLG